jgi:hypothetical protein
MCRYIHVLCEVACHRGESGARSVPAIKFELLQGGVYPDAHQLTLRSMGMMAATINHFRSHGQFLGSSGSLRSNETTLVTASGCRRGSLPLSCRAMFSRVGDSQT